MWFTISASGGSGDYTTYGLYVYGLNTSDVESGSTSISGQLAWSFYPTSGNVINWSPSEGTSYKYYAIRGTVTDSDGNTANVYWRYGTGAHAQVVTVTDD